MTLADTVTIALNWLQANWIVPASIVALYFYGRYHFNTPGYALELKDKNGQPLDQAGRLVSLAPPRFTTSRARFERFALGYVLILTAGFLSIVFLPNVVGEIGRILKFSVPIPSIAETIEHRALIALFAVTGALSSFPKLKDWDARILRRLHQAALIRDEAARLAKQLYDADFVPSAATAKMVREQLSRRDTIRVAEKQASGSLESTLLKALWLKTQLLEITNKNRRYLQFSIAVRRDLDDIASLSNTLRADLISYFKDQEECLPDSVTDIDNFISDNLDKADVQALNNRRHQLMSVCTALYYRQCLIAALLVYATQPTPSHVDNTLNKEIGFQLQVTATPAWEWDTIARVVGSIFLAALVLGAGFKGFIALFDLETNWSRAITRDLIALQSIIEALMYAFTLLIAIRLKRHWLFGGRRHEGIPENVLIAMCGFAVALLFVGGLQACLRGYVNSAALLQSAPMGVAGYFAGLYIDRSMNKEPVSVRLVFWQGALQAAAMFLAVNFSPDPPSGDTFPVVMKMYIAGYIALGVGVGAMVMGWMFQHYYQRCEFAPDHSEGGAGGIAVIGDLSLQRRRAPAD